jgi:hypothetical protein
MSHNQNQIELSITQIHRDLENGLTRYKVQDQGFGSIEEKYAMTPKEVEIIFRHSKLKDRHHTPFRFKLIDDTDALSITGSFVDNQKTVELHPSMKQELSVNLTTVKDIEDVTETVLPVQKTIVKPNVLNYL